MALPTSRWREPAIASRVEIPGGLFKRVKSIGIAIEPSEDGNTSNPEGKSPVKREDLKLICFDYVWQ